MIIRFLSSLHLTLILLLGLALVSIYGTLEPVKTPMGGQQIARYEIFYQSSWFRLLLCLLALNLMVCTIKTIRRNLRDRRRHLEVLQSERVFATPLRYVLPRDIEMERLAAGLRRQGYGVESDGECLVAQRGLAGRWGSTLVHLSVLAIMVGALTAELGFVGTLNIYSGGKSDVYFDWKEQRDKPLGFEFRLDLFEPIYYPIELRFAALDPASRRVIQTYTVREGDEVALPLPGVRAKVRKFFPDQEHLVLDISQRGAYLGEYHALGGKGEVVDLGLGLELRPVAYRDPLLKQLHSEVSILEDGKVVRSGVIEVNQPLVYEGVTIYQTAFNKDKFGFWFAGFQFARDPGKPVVWGACITLMIGLLCAFAIPYRAVGVSRVDGEVLLVALSGFRGEGGTVAFDRLESHLTVDGG